MPRKAKIANWGLYPWVDTQVEVQTEAAQMAAYVQQNGSLIPRGNGRCYGDSALNDQTILSSEKLNKFLSFDEQTGIIECQSGVLLSDILEVMVPMGWFLPVTPGTKFISVGGAVASDVHGKSHHVDGNFSNYLVSFELITPNGDILQCSKTDNEEIFWATCGGMGLTGVVTKAKFQLRKVETAYINQVSHKAANLDEIFELLDHYKEQTYSVAWIDCLSKGKKLGRSVLNVGEHATISELSKTQVKRPLEPHDPPKINMPLYLPSFVLNPLSIKAFNFLYYNKQMAKIKRDIVHYDPFYYPLDVIYNWNRMYGKNGFTQYQFVLPLETGKKGMEAILNTINSSGEGSFLAVLKLFGKSNPKEYLSFPMEGYTLALDFKINKRVFALLDKLDKMVLEYGGRVYLTKDVRLQQAMFEKTYPRVAAFKEIIKALNSGGKFRSLQSDRLGLTSV